jgi:hypothetical protein
VKSSALPEFWTRLELLPPKVQRIARKNFVLWQKQPGLKSLGFKRTKHDLWSVWAGCRLAASPSSYSPLRMPPTVLDFVSR